MRKKQSEKGRQTSHGELHANESETICKRAFISPRVKRLHVGDVDAMERVRSLFIEREELTIII